MKRTHQLTAEEIHQFRTRDRYIRELQEKLYIHQAEFNSFAQGLLQQKQLDGFWRWEGKDELVLHEEETPQPKIQLVQ